MPYRTDDDADRIAALRSEYEARIRDLEAEIARLRGQPFTYEHAFVRWDISVNAETARREVEALGWQGYRLAGVVEGLLIFERPKESHGRVNAGRTRARPGRPYRG